MRKQDEVLTHSLPFSGFPNSAEATVIPRMFFSRVLPDITDAAELVVTLWIFFTQALHQRRPHFVTLEELRADPSLARTFANLAGDPDAALDRGLTLAVKRGTLARASTRADGRSPVAARDSSSAQRQQVFVVNTPANRKALEPLLEHGATIDRPVARQDIAPSIFSLYEETVGPITPLIADELSDAETQYPPDWIAAAFREAAELNKRNWRYVHRILERWKTEGRDEKPERDTEAEWLARRYSQGKQRPA